MVTNSFKHSETNEIIEKSFHSIHEQDAWEATHPEYSIIFTTPVRPGDPFHLGVQKVPDDFRQGILEPMKRYWSEATSHDGRTKVGKLPSRAYRGRKEI